VIDLLELSGVYSFSGNDAEAHDLRAEVENLKMQLLAQGAYPSEKVDVLHTTPSTSPSADSRTEELEGDIRLLRSKMSSLEVCTPCMPSPFVADDCDWYRQVQVTRLILSVSCETRSRV
jgi:hypothetical protein